MSVLSMRKKKKIKLWASKLINCLIFTYFLPFWQKACSCTSLNKTLYIFLLIAKMKKNKKMFSNFFIFLHFQSSVEGFYKAVFKSTIAVGLLLLYFRFSGFTTLSSRKVVIRVNKLYYIKYFAWVFSTFLIRSKKQ